MRLTNNKGLAQGFQAGLDASLKLGADVIVNTDADNQYNAADIPKLVAPILRGEADLVVGDREVQTIEHFSPVKKLLQRLGSWVVRRASETTVPDTTSGFRAYNREAALQVQVVSRFTYTLETIIQAGKMLVAIDHVPIRTNPKMRESRLFKSISSYVRTNALAIFRIYTQYEPLRVFLIAAALVALVAAVVWGRFFVLFVQGDGAGHIQSVVLGAMLFVVAVQLAALGIIGDLLAANRVADPAHARAHAADRAEARRRALALRARRAPRARAAAAGETITAAARRGPPADRGARDGAARDGRREQRGRQRPLPDASRPATPTTSTARPTRS